jgi:phosphatidylinositol-3-phosphatase
VKKILLLALMLIARHALGDTLPRPDHIVIVIEENKPYTQIIGNTDAAYINALAERGMLFTESYGVTHPSQPNYLALFAGSTFGISSDACPLDLEGPNLASNLQSRKLSFALYAESLPRAGAEDCIYGAYFRKHNPVADWHELAAYSLPFSGFPRDFGKLPTVALVIPDQGNDMHDGSIAQGDAWLRQNIDSYAKWAMTHNSLLIVTWDEDDHSALNHIATIFVGEVVQRGRSAQRISHYSVLRTIEEMYGLPHLGESASLHAIKGVWRK